MSKAESCSLCRSPIISLSHRIDEEDDLLFCCKGCQVVYQILKVQGALDQFHNHPVYRQALEAGLITNPSFNPSKVEEESIPEEDFKKLHLTIHDMWCPSCAQVIHLILIREKGVRSCTVDYSTDLASIEYTPRLISRERVIRLIEQLGYRPQSLQDPRRESISRALLLRFIIAAFFSLNVMMFAYPIYATYFEGGAGEYAMLFAWLSLAGSLPVLLYSAAPIWRRGYAALRVGIWGMEVLVALGVGAATALSLYELFQGSPYVYFDSMTVIIVFVLLGKMIESRAKFSAKDALVNLSLALPRRGRKRFASGEMIFVPIKEFSQGDELVVRMGEKVVLDGVVIEGSGACDESVMTGEALPVAKSPGASVLAGSILQQGHLVIRVSSSLEGTALHHIIDMVGQEVSHKSRYVRAADQIVHWFVPLVIILAFLTAGYCYIFGVADGNATVLQTMVIRAVSVLLISCPCAIGIAAPLAESYTLNALAKVGMIVRNRGCFSFLGKETVFVFDKTGTVTEGRFSVLSGLESLSFEEKRALKGLIAHSLHPIAVALSGTLLCPPAVFERVNEVVGRGMEGESLGESYTLGSTLFLSHKGIACGEEPPPVIEGLVTTVHFAKGGQCLTTIHLGDRLKKESAALIASLAPMKTMLVSGDSPLSVERTAQACKIPQWVANCHPLEKRALIEQLKGQGEIVAMVGDGINDAPALTAANVGIAVVTASDISIQVSDSLLTSGNFHTLAILRTAACKGQRIVKQNLFWAFFYNVVGIGLAMAGLLSPLFAAFAMAASSLIVLLNARRAN